MASAHAQELVSRHEHVHVVVSPPRSASTAFVRVLWNNPRVGWYAHEPFEAAYFEGYGPEHAWQSARGALDLSGVTGAKTSPGLLIKEVSFQVGDRVGELLDVATSVPVFLIRDPRLSIRSRREVKHRAGQPLEFPLEETGWPALERQIAFCEKEGRDYVLVDTGDVRAHPGPVMAEVSARLGLGFDEAQLSWEPQPDLVLSNHRTSGVDHFFTRVLGSRGIEPPLESVPDVEEFPTDGGLREHVRWATDLYHGLRQSPKLVHPDH
jgi:Sulfotransferase domain